MRWHTRPLFQLAVMFVVMGAIVALQQTITVYIARGQSAPVPMVLDDAGLVHVQAGGCTYRAGSTLSTGQTETNPANAEPRWPIKDPKYTGEYDVFNNSYFTLEPNTDTKYRGYFTDGGEPDDKMTGFLGSMFGYKPKNFIDAYNMKYADPLLRGNDPKEIKGDHPALAVPVPSDQVVVMAKTAYDIGGGEAMVVFADANRIALHIGRHEYFVGTRQCLGGPCSGGYWIYLTDICVNQNILDAYNSVKAAQWAANADLNPIQLPIVPEGYPLGRATGSKVTVAVRDNGPFILMNREKYWQGYQEVDFGAGGVPPTGTQAPQPTQPPPTGPTPGVPGCFFMTADVQNWQESGKAKFNITVKFHSAGGDGDILLEKNGVHVAGWNRWNKSMNNPYVLGPQWTGGAIEVSPGTNASVRFTGHVANTVACPGVRTDMQCTFTDDGTCNCGGTSCQPFVAPTQPAASTPAPTGTTTTPAPTGTTPTVPPPEASPTITIQGGSHRMVFTFARCDGNELCQHLIQLMPPSETRHAIANYSIQSDSANYTFRLNLGSSIIRADDSPSTGMTQISLKRHDGEFPDLSSTKSLKILLPEPSNGSTLPTYVLK